MKKILTLLSIIAIVHGTSCKKEETPVATTTSTTSSTSNANTTSATAGSTTNTTAGSTTSGTDTTGTSTTSGSTTSTTNTSSSTTSTTVTTSGSTTSTTNTSSATTSTTATTSGTTSTTSTTSTTGSTDPKSSANSAALNEVTYEFNYMECGVPAPGQFCVSATIGTTYCKIFFKAKPTASKVYNITNKIAGNLLATDAAIDFSIAGTTTENYHSEAGGKLNVVIVNGKIQAWFNDASFKETTKATTVVGSANIFCP